MIFDYSLAGLVSAGLLFYLTYALLRPGSPITAFGIGPAKNPKGTPHDRHRLVSILLFCAIIVALVKPLGGYMTRVFNGERTFLSRSCGRLRPGCTGSAGSTRGASSTG